ncbi:MAG: hypothetical protein F2799_00915 [Actinobacteria bacterium]|uniref:Unannotated protein n=1 Tax=freshwater metagenome TaxID=449393 RepID=A0A6J7CTF5_9ZZZZ|nr:hypothetical protein [Actinomycetota bacterium]
MRSLVAKFTAATTWAFVSGALIAPTAFARISGGEGTYGATNDKVVTNFGFAIILLLPLLLAVLSVLQRRSEDREHEHLEAQSHRADLAEWQGGW